MYPSVLSLAVAWLPRIPAMNHPTAFLPSKLEHITSAAVPQDRANVDANKNTIIQGKIFSLHERKNKEEWRALGAVGDRSTRHRTYIHRV